MASAQFDLLNSVSEEEYKFSKYYAHALERKGISKSWSQQCSTIQDLKELLQEGYIKKIPIIMPMYQMPGTKQNKANAICMALLVADSLIVQMPGGRDFLQKLICLSFEYSPAGNAGKVTKAGIKAYFRRASKVVVKTAELIASPKRLTAIYYALGIFFINLLYLRESQETAETEGLMVYKKALTAIDQGIISLLC